MNFEVGQPFPLPIRAKGDGGLFQIDTNGVMFILQLSRTDIIAVEAFRTGQMELALTEEEGLLFFLYRIDGIFKEGWGDAPLSLATLKEAQRPKSTVLPDAALHLYLVEPHLSLLLAQRTVTLSKAFRGALERHLVRRLAAPLSEEVERQKIGEIYQRLTPAALREKAMAVQQLPLAIKARPLH
ncbi:MAG: hypothetical protein ACFNWW_02105 [Negativicutes bacterium]